MNLEGSAQVSFRIGDFFNVESVKADIMNSSKRQTMPWTKLEELEREDELNTWTLVHQLKINSNL